MAQITVLEVPEHVKDRMMQQDMLKVIQCQDHSDGITESYEEYEINYDNFLKQMKPYHVNRRSDSKSGIWYMCWWGKGKDYRRSTGETNYARAKQVAEEMWQELCVTEELAG